MAGLFNFRGDRSIDVAVVMCIGTAGRIRETTGELYVALSIPKCRRSNVRV